MVAAWLLCMATCTAAIGEEVRGAPLGAPPDAAPSDAQPDPSAPDAPAPIRIIPEAAWEFLLKAETEDATPITTPHGVFQRVPFALLSGYDYEMPSPEAARSWESAGRPPAERIPKEVRELAGTEVMVAGFMVPLHFDQRGHVKAFALSQNRAFCCFGIPPAMHEWIMVETADELTVPYLNDIPIAVFGEMAVGEELDDGFVLSIYRMTAVEVSDLREIASKN